MYNKLDEIDDLPKSLKCVKVIIVTPMHHVTFFLLNIEIVRSRAFDSNYYDNYLKNEFNDILPVDKVIQKYHATRR